MAVGQSSIETAGGRSLTVYDADDPSARRCFSITARRRAERRTSRTSGWPSARACASSRTTAPATVARSRHAGRTVGDVAATPSGSRTHSDSSGSTWGLSGGSPHGWPVRRFCPTGWPRSTSVAGVAATEEGRRDRSRGEVAIEASPDATFLGLALVPTIDLEARTAELGYIVAEEARGHGVATEGLRLLTDWARLSELGALSGSSC